MADKQPQSSAANYDPSFPPAEQPRNLGRRCCCCLFRTFWILLVLIIVFFCLVILVLYIILQPRSFKFYVSEAKLSQFNYTANTNTFHYNLVLNFTARNPNKKLSIYYDKVEGHAFYDGVRFASTDVIPWQISFRQYTKSTDKMSGVFSGKRVVVLDRDQVSDFDQDKTNGVFNIDVKLYFTIRFRIGDLIGGDMKPKASCGLEVPFGSNGTTVTAFRPTKCVVDF